MNGGGRQNTELAKQVTGGTVRVTDDAFLPVERPELDIIVELIGGYAAKEVVMQGFRQWQHVVTANKALPYMALEILPAAQQRRICLCRCWRHSNHQSLREGLTANRVEWARHQWHNHPILPEMRDKGLSRTTC